MGPLNKEALHHVPISKAVQLTRGDAVKTALLLELEISVSMRKDAYLNEALINPQQRFRSVL